MMNRALLPALLLAGLLAACGKSEVATPPAAPAAAPAPAPAPTQVAAQANSGRGEHVFKQTCALCHASGAAGAPLFKSKDDWGPRIAQGKETLYTHALAGFTGSKGQMPAKGGNTALPDEDVKAAVDYMVSAAQ